MAAKKIMTLSTRYFGLFPEARKEDSHISDEAGGASKIAMEQKMEQSFYSGAPTQTCFLRHYEKPKVDRNSKFSDFNVKSLFLDKNWLIDVVSQIWPPHTAPNVLCQLKITKQ